jgi:hypothetical protein
VNLEGRLIDFNSVRMRHLDFASSGFEKTRQSHCNKSLHSSVCTSRVDFAHYIDCIWTLRSCWRCDSTPDSAMRRIAFCYRHLANGSLYPRTSGSKKRGSKIDVTSQHCQALVSDLLSASERLRVSVEMKSIISLFIHSELFVTGLIFSGTPRV